MPIDLIMRPRAPIRMPFWDSVSTHSSARTAIRPSRSLDLVDLHLDRVRDLLARAASTCSRTSSASITDSGWSENSSSGK